MGEIDDSEDAQGELDEIEAEIADIEQGSEDPEEDDSEESEIGESEDLPEELGYQGAQFDGERLGEVKAEDQIFDFRPLTPEEGKRWRAYAGISPEESDWYTFDITCGGEG